MECSSDGLSLDGKAEYIHSVDAHSGLLSGVSLLDSSTFGSK